MFRPDDNYQQRRYRTAYGTSVVSITLVLFMLGLLMLMVYHARKLTQYVKENIGMSLIIKEKVEYPEIMGFKRILDDIQFVRRTEFISKEQAALKMKEELGEDFVGFIGYNPLPATIVVFFDADYSNDDSLRLIKDQFLKNEMVKEVIYQKSMIELVDRNVSKITMGILFFSVLMLIISVILIHNTIRLAVYSKRLLIKSMALVGATQAFIRRPFIVNGVLQGVIGGSAAVILLLVIQLVVHIKMPELALLQEMGFIVGLCGMIIVFGIMITWFSNYIAVKKYLKINSEELF